MPPEELKSASPLSCLISLLLAADLAGRCQRFGDASREQLHAGDASGAQGGGGGLRPRVPVPWAGVRTASRYVCRPNDEAENRRPIAGRLRFVPVSTCTTTIERASVASISFASSIWAP